MFANSRQVTTNQEDIHPRLDFWIQRHRSHEHQGRIHESTKASFERLKPLIADSIDGFLLDSCCGTGASTQLLAAKWPNKLVIGCDQSVVRLGKGREFNGFYHQENLVLLRAKASHLWRLLLDHGFYPHNHFLFYPNPWPKASHVTRRWHAHHGFPTLLALGGVLELRTNWQLYAREFQYALAAYGHESTITTIRPGELPVSPFEKKYAASGHTLFRLRCVLREK